MGWVKKEDGGDGHTYNCNGCDKRVQIQSNWDAPVSNNNGTFCLSCVDKGMDTKETQ